MHCKNAKIPHLNSFLKMAEHESQALVKIVIPFDEYQRLKTIEVQFHNLQKEFVNLQSEKKIMIN